MFEKLANKLNKVVRSIKGINKFTEQNLKEIIIEIKKALIDADVSLEVIEQILSNIQTAALGTEIAQHLSPGQAFLKLLHTELVAIMRSEEQGLNLQTTPPAVILLAGLQGSGKTTSAAKLANYLTKKTKVKVLLTSCDIYRPAAIEQLAVLAQSLELDIEPSQATESITTIATRALETARKKAYDVLIVDTAGRLHIDEKMMTELRELHTLLNPIETLFVVDSMIGQDAANTAKAFHEALPLTGVILTKTDGDSRGGAALSIKYLTGKPIKFLGTGEKPDKLIAFEPERLANRMLGMGDALALIENLDQTANKQQLERVAKKVSKGRNLDLSDFQAQLLSIQNMGGISGIMKLLPNAAGSMLPPELTKNLNEKSIIKWIALIYSMTPKERQRPQLLTGSRKLRIAKGAGSSLLELNKLLKTFEKMHKMLAKFNFKNPTDMLGKAKGMLSSMGVNFEDIKSLFNKG